LSRRRCLPCRAAAAFVVALPLASSTCRCSPHCRAAGSAFVVAPPLPSSSCRRSLPCCAAGSAFIIALPLPSSSRRRRFCLCRCAAAGSAFFVAPPLPSSSRRRCLPRRAAAAFFVAPPDNRRQTTDDSLIFIMMTSQEGFHRRGSLFDLGGNGAFWQKKGVMLHGLQISKKKEILHKLTVFDDGGDSNCRLSSSRCLAGIQGPSLLIIEVKKDDPLRYMTVAVACTIAHL
jgi:hypothetical protein